MTDAPSVTASSDDTLRSALAALLPEFRARAAEGEQLRTMPADLVRQAKAGGLFRLNLPRSLGGLELDPAATAEIFEEISRADGSAGWTIVIGNSTAFFAWLDPAVAKELIGDEADFVSTSMWAPLGQAVPEAPGRFTVTGRWPFNSGCPHAAWLQVGVMVTGAGPPRPGGAPDWRFAFVPARSAVIEDTWDAMGLRGTGSHHLSLSGVQVPAGHLAAPFFEPARHDGPLWRIPLITLAAIFLAAVPLGVARRALDEFSALATSKVRGPATLSIGHDADAQCQLARAEGALASARSFLFDTIARIWATACQGDEPDLGQRALVLLAANQAVRAAAEAVDRVFRLAGAGAVHTHHPLLPGHSHGRPAHPVQRRPGPGLRQGPPRHRPAHLPDLSLPYHAVVTIRLASNGPQALHADTIGAAWLAVARRILAEGITSRYDGLPVREISLVTLAVDRPDPADEIIASCAEPGRLAWMHANFTDHAQVAALGGADSYATRLFDYEHSGRDQVAWVVDRLRRDPATRSAAITTFQPHTDASYIPCVSLLDFWLPDGAVELIAYAHSIDFGAKGYGNLVELAALQQHVAGRLGRPAGRLLMMVKSAHVYETERVYLQGVLAGAAGS
jgi:indole-3-acetate monooxygenase